MEFDGSILQAYALRQYERIGGRMVCHETPRSARRGRAVPKGGLKSALAAATAAICLPLLLGVPAACAAGPAAKSAPDKVALAIFKSSIRKLYDMKERAWAAGDVRTIVDRFYAPDAVSVGEGEPNVLVGRKQFLDAYRQYLSDVRSVRIESVRSVVNGSAGWDWANFYFTPRPEKVRDYPPSPIRILFLWSKRDGQWVCEGEMFVNGKFKNPL